MKTNLDEQNFLREYFSSGESTAFICEKLGISKHKGYHYIRKNNLKSRPRTNKYCDKDIELVCNLYTKGKTIKQIAKEHPHLKEGWINFILRKKELTRSNGKQCKYDVHYFKSINTKEKAYFLGLLYADGSLCRSHKNSYSLQLALHYKDKYILEAFLKEINADLTITEPSFQKQQRSINGKNYMFERSTCKISITNKTMGEELLEQGLVLNKTIDLANFPKLPTEFIPAFILGFYDGDGIASSGKATYMGFCGTEKFLKELEGKLEDLGLESKKIYYNKSNKIWYLQYNKKDQIKKLYDIFYTNPPKIFLLRKKEKIYRYLFS